MARFPAVSASSSGVRAPTLRRTGASRLLASRLPAAVRRRRGAPESTASPLLTRVLSAALALRRWQRWTIDLGRRADIPRSRRRPVRARLQHHPWPLPCAARAVLLQLLEATEPDLLTLGLALGRHARQAREGALSLVEGEAAQHSGAPAGSWPAPHRPRFRRLSRQAARAAARARRRQARRRLLALRAARSRDQIGGAARAARKRTRDS